MKIDFSKILLYCYGLLFFLTPLIVFHRTSELFEFNKMIFIYLMTAVILLIWTIRMICHKKIIIKKTFLDIPIWLFFFSQLLSTVFSIDRHTSLFGYYGRFNGGLIALASYLILYYGFVSNLTRSSAATLLRISLVSSALVILIGLPGRLGRDLLCLIFTGSFTNSCWTDQFQPALRMFSTLGQPNWLGAYLAAHLFIGLYFLLTARERRVSISMAVYFLYLLLNFTAILFTRSRSALLAVAMVMAAVWIWFAAGGKIRKDLLMKLALLSLSLLVLAGIFKTGISSKIDQYMFGPATNPKVFSAGPVKITDSSDIRKIVWRGALALGLRYPILGTGVETFAYSYYFTRPLAHNLTSEWDFVYNKAHNEYLNFLATTGFIGLGTYLFFILAFIWIAVKRQKSIKSLKSGESLNILLVAWITILITNFFGFSTTTVNLFFFLIPAFILASDHIGSDDQKVKLDLRQKSLVSLSVFGFGAIFIFLLSYFAADMYYARAEELSRADRWEEASRILTKALRIHYEHVYEDDLSSYLAAQSYLSSYQNSEEATGKLIRLAEGYNDRALSKSPYNVLYLKTRAKNQFLFYQATFAQRYFDEAIAALRTASGLAPTDARIPYLKTLFYSYAADGAGDKNRQAAYQREAVAAVEVAIALKSDFRDAYFLKGQLLKKYGQKDEAQKAFEHILRYLNPQDEEVKGEIKKL